MNVVVVLQPYLFTYEFLGEYEGAYFEIGKSLHSFAVFASAGLGRRPFILLSSK